MHNWNLLLQLAIVKPVIRGPFQALCRLFVVSQARPSHILHNNYYDGLAWETRLIDILYVVSLLNVYTFEK